TEVEIEGLDPLKHVHAKKKDMIDPNNLPTYLRENMDITIKFQRLLVDGEEIAIIESPQTLDLLEDELKEAYFDDKDVNAKFSNDVKLEEVYTTEDKLVEMDTLVDLCKKRQRKEVVYTVAPGDSLWSIATKYNLSVEDLTDANEGLTNNLKIGQEIKANVRVPVLGMELVKEAP
ncbi:MAG: LysM domain-containing protein, partial [Niameybacter sp.]